MCGTLTRYAYTFALLHDKVLARAPCFKSHKLFWPAILSLAKRSDVTLLRIWNTYNILREYRGRIYPQTKLAAQSDRLRKTFNMRSKNFRGNHRQGYMRYALHRYPYVETNWFFHQFASNASYTSFHLSRSSTISLNFRNSNLAISP